MINKITYKECTVCQACINICPNKCINLEKEVKSIKYPVIDRESCINCRMCEKVCPIIKCFESKNSLNNVYAAMNLDDSIKVKSSSGGVFSALAKNFLENNGCVSGVTFDKDFNSKHIIINNINDLNLIRGSKYLQSNNNYVYKEIEQKLKKGINVLFSGCPCQVAGLKSFLQKEYSNLFTLDIICHGIPSQQIFRGYINILEKKYKSKVSSINFREKSTGWNNSSIKILFENDKVYKKLIIDDMYMKGYFQNITLKESCYECRYRNFKSGSDITLGDFWGAEVIHNDIDYKNGLSVIIINSNKGNLMFDKIKHNLFIKKSNIEEVAKYNMCLYNSPQKNNKRTIFFEELQKGGYKRAFNKTCKDNIYITIKKSVRRKVGKLKRLIL